MISLRPLPKPSVGRGVAFEEFASGWLTPLMFAARENDLESARLLIKAGADIDAQSGDGKDALSLALFDVGQVPGHAPRYGGVERTVAPGKPREQGGEGR